MKREGTAERSREVLVVKGQSNGVKAILEKSHTQQKPVTCDARSMHDSTWLGYLGFTDAYIGKPYVVKVSFQTLLYPQFLQPVRLRLHTSTIAYEKRNIHDPQAKLNS